MRKLIYLLFVSLAMPVCAKAKGTAYSGKTAYSGGAAFLGAIEDMPIWVDLRLPDGDGKATGAYLYLKHGKPIDLAGGIPKGIGNLFKTDAEVQFYLEDGKAYVGYSHFLGLGDQRRSDLGIGNDDVFIDVPMRDLAKYLKKESVLRKLGEGE